MQNLAYELPRKPIRRSCDASVAQTQRIEYPARNTASRRWYCVYQVRLMREARGMTQVQLAAASGVNRATINQIERGRRKATLETLEKLALALDAEMADFFPKMQARLFTPSVHMTAGQLDVPEGSPDPRFWGADEDRPNPAVGGIPSPGGRQIRVEIAEGQPEGTRVKITSQSFLEVFRQVKRGELTPEQAVKKVERIVAA